VPCPQVRDQHNLLTYEASANVVKQVSVFLIGGTLPGSLRARFQALQPGLFGLCICAPRLTLPVAHTAVAGSTCGSSVPCTSPAHKPRHQSAADTSMTCLVPCTAHLSGICWRRCGVEANMRGCSRFLGGVLSGIVYATHACHADA